jgi:transposase-like protein
MKRSGKKRRNYTKEFKAEASARAEKKKSR